MSDSIYYLLTLANQLGTNQFQLNLTVTKLIITIKKTLFSKVSLVSLVAKLSLVSKVYFEAKVASVFNQSIL